MMKNTLATLFLLAAIPVAAQQVNNQDRTLKCDDRSREDRSSERSCEMREYPLAASPKIIVDGGINGGMTIKGWDGSDMLVRAKVETWAPSAGEARSIASQVNVLAAGGNIRSSAPEFGRDRGWAVSYEIFVPHRTGLNLKAHNGGIKISDVTGEIDFEALNGGVSLARLGGAVKGKTTNGGLKIELTGTKWDGSELDVSATNGGVSLEVPENYSARFETSTVNGRVSVDFPISVQGRIDRQLSFNLGSGGSLIRAITTNGGVSVKRKS